MRGFTTQLLLVGACTLTAACPFSRFAELAGSDPADAHQRRLLDVPAPFGAPAADAPGPSTFTAAHDYAADATPALKFYKAPTLPDGRPDLAVIFNNTGMDAALMQSTRRLGASLQSFFNYTTTLPDTLRNGMSLPAGAERNLISGSIQEIYESLTAFRQLGGLAMTAALQRLPMAAMDQLEADLLRLRNDRQLAAADDVYRTAFQVLMFTISPTTYGLTLRLAFHDAASHNPNAPAGKSKGGANGSVRFEADWPSNGGLQRFVVPEIEGARRILDVVLPGNGVSYADLIAICGAVGTFQTQGPFVNVGWGRPDATRADPFTGVGSDTNESRDYPIAELLYEWNKFGFNATELTVLSGAHSIGTAASTNPQGKLDGRGSFHFGKQYYQNVRDGIAFFGSDKALYNSPLTRPLVDTFADSNEAYFAQWIPIYTRLTMLGVDPSIDLHTQRF